MPIVWRDQMSVGVKEIDDDHQTLIDIINDFEDAAKLGAGKADDAHMRSLLRRLQHYARDHFSREERIQERAVYDGLTENKVQHGLMLNSLNDLIIQYTGGKLGPSVEATETMTTFLNHWLIQHILKTDLKMRGKISNR